MKKCKRREGARRSQNPEETDRTFTLSKLARDIPQKAKGKGRQNNKEIDQLREKVGIQALQMVELLNSILRKTRIMDKSC